MSIPVPQGTKSKELAIEIKKKTIKVAFKGKGPEGVLLEGELPKEIKVDDSTWTLGASSPAASAGASLSSAAPELTCVS